MLMMPPSLRWTNVGAPLSAPAPKHYNKHAYYAFGKFAYYRVPRGTPKEARSRADGSCGKVFQERRGAGRRRYSQMRPRIGSNSGMKP